MDIKFVCFSFCICARGFENDKQQDTLIEKERERGTDTHLQLLQINFMSLSLSLLIYKNSFTIVPFVQ